LTLVAPAALRLTTPCCGAATSPGEIKEIDKIEFLRPVAPSNFLLLKLYKPAHCGGLCKIQNSSNSSGMLLPQKEP
jgi:hypothetical protein